MRVPWTRGFVGIPLLSTTYYHLPLTAYRLSLTYHLPTTYRPPPTTNHLPPTTYHPPSTTCLVHLPLATCHSSLVTSHPDDLFIHSLSFLSAFRSGQVFSKRPLHWWDLHGGEEVRARGHLRYRTDCTDTGPHVLLCSDVRVVSAPSLITQRLSLTGGGAALAPPSSHSVSLSQEAGRH